MAWIQNSQMEFETFSKWYFHALLFLYTYYNQAMCTQSQYFKFHHISPWEVAVTCLCLWNINSVIYKIVPNCGWNMCLRILQTTSYLPILSVCISKTPSYLVLLFLLDSTLWPCDACERAVSSSQ